MATGAPWLTLRGASALRPLALRRRGVRWYAGLKLQRGRIACAAAGGERIAHRAPCGAGGRAPRRAGAWRAVACCVCSPTHPHAHTPTHSPRRGLGPGTPLIPPFARTGAVHSPRSGWGLSSRGRKTNCDRPRHPPPLGERGVSHSSNTVLSQFAHTFTVYLSRGLTLAVASRCGVGVNDPWGGVKGWGRVLDFCVVYGVGIGGRGIDLWVRESV